MRGFLKCLPIILVIAIAGRASGQEVDSIPEYKKHPGIPSFHLLQADSSWFRSSELPAGRPIVMIYFNADCGHCQHEAKQIASNMNSFGNAFFVFSSYSNAPAEIGAFMKTYQLAGYRNIRAGRDTGYYLPAFYRVQFTPFIAIYNKQHKLVRVFEQGADAGELEGALKL